MRLFDGDACKMIKIKDLDSAFIALTFNAASDIIKDQLSIIQKILRHFNPQSFEPCWSDKHGYAFDSIHPNSYNCFAEKGSIHLDPFIAFQLIYVSG